MISRVCALWLVLLIVLPFAPPFSTCDLGTIYPAAATRKPREARGPNDHRVPLSSLEHQATAHALPHSGVKHRAKWMAVNVQSPLTEVVHARPRRHAIQAHIVRSAILIAAPLRI